MTEHEKGVIHQNRIYLQGSASSPECRDQAAHHLHKAHRTAGTEGELRRRSADLLEVTEHMQVGPINERGKHRAVLRCSKTQWTA